MRNTTLGRWRWVHRWTSLVCTAFMLLLCITGLPLIFSHEIAHALHSHIEPRVVAPDTPDASLDHILAAAQAQAPGLVPQYVYREADEPQLWSVMLGPSPQAQVGVRTLVVDARTAEFLGELRTDEGFMHVMWKLHVDLFAGLPGTLLLGAMGLLLLAAIVSGAVLYGPWTRKLAFGAIRRERSARSRWLDIHNLLGIVTLTWAFVVGATGVINTLGEPVLKLWQHEQMSQMLAPYRGQAPSADRASLQRSADAAQALEPALRLGFIAFPGTPYSSPHHYAMFMQGREPLTSRLYKPVLVDARSARVTDSRPMSWYVTAVLVSQPLHFGDYGGLPMKVIWALLDIATIVVLASGLVLWRQRAGAERRAESEPAGLGVMHKEAA
jgi:uncharacterized iron-regulated membrane protein